MLARSEYAERARRRYEKSFADRGNLGRLLNNLSNFLLGHPEEAVDFLEGCGSASLSRRKTTRKPHTL